MPIEGFKTNPEELYRKHSVLRPENLLPLFDNPQFQTIRYVKGTKNKLLEGVDDFFERCDIYKTGTTLAMYINTIPGFLAEIQKRFPTAVGFKTHEGVVYTMEGAYLDPDDWEEIAPWKYEDSRDKEMAIVAHLERLRGNPS